MTKRRKFKCGAVVDDENSVHIKASLTDWSKGENWATDCPRFWPFIRGAI